MNQRYPQSRYFMHVCKPQVTQNISVNNKYLCQNTRPDLTHRAPQSQSTEAARLKEGVLTILYDLL